MISKGRTHPPAGSHRLLRKQKTVVLNPGRFRTPSGSRGETPRLSLSRESWGYYEREKFVKEDAFLCLLVPLGPRKKLSRECGSGGEALFTPVWGKPSMIQDGAKALTRNWGQPETGDSAPRRRRGRGSSSFVHDKGRLSRRKRGTPAAKRAGQEIKKNV